MTEFIARNGVIITEGQSTVSLRRRPDATLYMGYGAFGEAVKEYVDHVRANALGERDDELGRWRWPESPSYIVYPGRAGWLLVLREQFGTSEVFRIEDVCASVWKPMSAAKAYLDAHPEPKPWHDAKPGEVWELTFSEDGGGGTDAWTVSQAGLFEHPNFVSRVSPKDRTIMSGARLWMPRKAAE